MSGRCVAINSLKFCIFSSISQTGKWRLRDRKRPSPKSLQVPTLPYTHCYVDRMRGPLPALASWSSGTRLPLYLPVHLTLLVPSHARCPRPQLSTFITRLAFQNNTTSATPKCSLRRASWQHCWLLPHVCLAFFPTEPQFCLGWHCAGESLTLCALTGLQLEMVTRPSVNQ